MLLYLIVFYKYTFKKASFLKQICACIVFFIVVFGYVFTEEDNEMLLTRLGEDNLILYKIKHNKVSSKYVLI